MKYITVLPIIRQIRKGKRSIMWVVFLDGIVYDSFTNKKDASDLAKDLAVLNPSAKLNWMKDV